MKNATTVRHRLAPLVLFAALLFACGGFRGAASGSGSQTSGASPSSSAAGTSANAQSPHPFLGTYYPSQGHTHLTPGEPDDFVYNSNPPTSGPHREVFNDAFLSSTPLPNYLQAHLLEHGNVLLQYNCNCPDIKNALGTIAMQYDKHLIPSGQQQSSPADVRNGEDQGLAVIVAPNSRMKSKIALTAWTRLATLQSVDEAKIASFINAYLHNQANANR